MSQKQPSSYKEKRKMQEVEFFTHATIVQSKQLDNTATASDLRAH